MGTVINMSRVVKGAVLSLLSMHGLNAICVCQKDFLKRFLYNNIPNFAKSVGLDQNQVHAINSYFYDKGVNARSFFFYLVFERRKEAILHANKYIQEKKSQIEKLAIHDVNSAVKKEQLLQPVFWDILRIAKVPQKVRLQ